jgi:hypothetical protein
MTFRANAYNFPLKSTNIDLTSVIVSSLLRAFILIFVGAAAREEAQVMVQERYWT